jgi:hypothetical protein
MDATRPKPDRSRRAADKLLRALDRLLVASRDVEKARAELTRETERASRLRLVTHEEEPPR